MAVKRVVRSAAPGRATLTCRVRLLQWATLRIERGAKEKNHPLYKPYINGKVLPYVGTYEVQNSLWKWGRCVSEQLRGGPGPGSQLSSSG